MLEINKNGNRLWKNEEGKLHRDNGPAIERSDGTKQWWVNEKKHREDGPAMEWADGTKCWYMNGKLHRKSAPAVEWHNGNKEWWLDGTRYSEEEYKKKIGGIC